MSAQEAVELRAQPAFTLSMAMAVLTCALAPTYVIRWHVGPLPTTLLEVFILATIAVFASEALRGRQVFQWRSPFTLPTVSFLVAGAIGVLVSPEQVKGLGLYRAYLVEPIAFFFIV